MSLLTRSQGWTGSISKGRQHVGGDNEPVATPCLPRGAVVAEVETWAVIATVSLLSNDRRQLVRAARPLKNEICCLCRLVLSSFVLARFARDPRDGLALRAPLPRMEHRFQTFKRDARPDEPSSLSSLVSRGIGLEECSSCLKLKRYDCVIPGLEVISNERNTNQSEANGRVVKTLS